MGESDQQFTNALDTFDHVVVLMLENRSFDNLFGYLYSQEYPVPPGKQFEGVEGKNLSNPIPPEWQFNDGNGKRVTKVPVGPIVAPNNDIDLTAFCPPYPDPGEDYPHVNTQLFYNPLNPDGVANPPPVPYNHPPYNLPTDPKPAMTGFVTDYILNYVKNEFPKNEFPNWKPPSPGQAFYNTYKYIMESYRPEDIPVLSGLAREFGVFDHWFCSVPSETICNRNFWHAGTSWGHVINPGPGDDPGDDPNQPNTDSWLYDTLGDTLFSQLWEAGIRWKIYSDNRIPISKTKNFSLPVTPLLHFLNFLVLSALEGLKVFDADIFNTLDGFKSDCAAGKLPAYSFIEPNFFNPHNDMHPSTPGELGDGSQKISPVLLGDALVWEVYNAIFTSQHHCDNTLLIITFDEHGGCYDHVSPPGRYGDNLVKPAAIATPPDLCGYKKWDGFDFKRLGLRVPTIMVSPYIKKNTIINDCMSHSSFLKTMHAKKGWPNSSLSAREDASPYFHNTGLLWPTRQRDKMPIFAAPVIPPDDTDYSKAVMSALANAIISIIKELWCKAFPEECPTMEIKTQDQAAAFLRDAVYKSKVKLRQVDAVKGELNERDWVPLLQAIAEGLKKKEQWYFFVLRIYRKCRYWLCHWFRWITRITRRP